MPFHITRNDIAAMRTDAVVVPANSSLLINGSAGELVARIAGLERLQEACNRLGGCAVGKAVVTPAFDFPAKMIVHAVGPVWNGGVSGEDAALYSCVSESLRAAWVAGAQTMALPLLSAGAFGYPSSLAIDVEMRAIRDFLATQEADVWLVLYDHESMRAGRAMFKKIDERIDDVYVASHGYEGTKVFHDHTRIFEESVLGADRSLFSPNCGASLGEALPQTAFQEKKTAPTPTAKRAGLFKKKKTKTALAPMAKDLNPEAQLAQMDGSFAQTDLAAQLDQMDESFAQTVLRLIDERGMKDPEVYKRANMSRQLFAKIRKDDNYRPTKRTACALAFALDLGYKDALALLSRAGFTLSHSSKFDIIIEWFLLNEIHDIFQINEALFAYDQPLLV